ncbi:MAG: hypothetical protein FJ147_04655 [Deltaproteobacteria bacterium]|nr:hypothetical protein [Deltaproteobacteria bacterium]
MATKVTEHYLEFGGMKYFRENAHNVEMCSYGEKKDPIGPRVYLDVQNKIKPEYLEGRVRHGQELSYRLRARKKRIVPIAMKLTGFDIERLKLIVGDL